MQTFNDYGTKVENELARHPQPLALPGAERRPGLRRRDRAVVLGPRNVNAWDNVLDRPDRKPRPTRTMQQATVNLLAEMGAQPSTLTTGLVAGDRIDRPHAADRDDHLADRRPDREKRRNGDVTGTAADVGGVVAAVEVSTDGGKTWHPATGTTSWTYAWNVDGAQPRRRSRRGRSTTRPTSAPPSAGVSPSRSTAPARCSAR